MQAFVDLDAQLGDVDLLVEESDALLANLTPADRNKANVLTRAGIVLLCGFLEGYIRDVITEFVESVNDAGIPLHALPEPIVLVTLDSFVSRCKKDSAWLPELTRTVAGGCVHSLDVALFTRTGGNPTVDVIDGLFASVGIPDVIEVLTVRDFQTQTHARDSQVTNRLSEAIGRILLDEGGANAEHTRDKILALMDTTLTPRKRRRDVGYVYHIQELLKRRNRIAHGEGHEPVTPHELREFRAKITLLARGLAAELDLKLAGVTNRPL